MHAHTYYPEYLVRNGKREMIEGGLRVPYFVRWPGKIKRRTVTDHLCHFADVMPTLAEARGARTPEDIDESQRFVRPKHPPKKRPK